MNMQHRYNEGFASVENVATAMAANPDQQFRAVELLVRELAAGVAKGDLDVADWSDRVQEIAVRTGMVETHGQDRIQAMMTGAIISPMHLRSPSPATTSALDAGIRTGEVVSSGDARARTVELVVRRASDIKPEPIDWLWPGRVAIGKLTMLAGEPGLGKSQLTCWVSAAVTTGGRWPGNEGTASIGSAIILSAEDDAADTVRPRLDAAGADVSRVYIVSAVRVDDGSRRSFNIQADLVLLEQEIKRIGDVRLVVIDPVSSYLGRVDSHKNAELRAVLEPIGEMASRMGVAVVAVTHLSKGGSGGANNRIIGSIAFVAAARAAFIVCRDPDDSERRLFLPTKNNLGREGDGIGFRVGVQLTPSGILAPSIFWDADPVKMSADDVLAAGDRGEVTSGDEAEDFLRDLLVAGPVPTKTVKAEAGAAELSWATVRRAKDRIGVRAVKAKEADGGWLWTLAEVEDVHAEVEGAPLSEMSTFAENSQSDEHLRGSPPRRST